MAAGESKAEVSKGQRKSKIEAGESPDVAAMHETNPDPLIAHGDA